MLAIARALMARPKLLMLDEPSQGFAPKVAASILSTLNELKGEISILLVEQNVHMALKSSDYAYLIHGGRIIKEGSSEELSDVEEIRRAYLGI